MKLRPRRQVPLSLSDRLEPSRRLARMGSYYPAHGVLHTLTGIDVLDAHIPSDDGGYAGGHGDHDPTAARPVHYCSVRGCSTVLPYEYTHKMCETCRSRHRTYASTKRAKRKQEKAMLGAQAGAVWMPSGSSGDVDAHNAPVVAPRVSHSLPPNPEPVREIEVRRVTCREATVAHLRYRHLSIRPSQLSMGTPARLHGTMRWTPSCSNSSSQQAPARSLRMR